VIDTHMTRAGRSRTIPVLVAIALLALVAFRWIGVLVVPLMFLVIVGYVLLDAPPRYRRHGLSSILQAKDHRLGIFDRWYPADRHDPIASQQTGRNQPCPCGSGRKFKKCCGTMSA